MNDDFDPHALDDEIAHLDRGGDVAGWVRDEPTELPPVRMDDRVHFLPAKNEYGDVDNRTKVGASQIAVILWTDRMKDEAPIVLAVDSGSMSLHQSMTPEMARRIGLALIAAADEAKGSTP